VKCLRAVEQFMIDNKDYGGKNALKMKETKLDISYTRITWKRPDIGCNEFF